jgi:nucleolar protein 56
MGDNFTRRRALKAVALVGATATAGCLGDNTDKTDDETPTDEGASGEDGDGETDPSLTFDHPDTVRSDESFGVSIGGLPAETTAEITVTAESELREPSTALTVETEDGQVDLATAEVVDGREWTYDESDVWTGLDVPPSVAPLQFLDLVSRSYDSIPQETVTYEVAVAGETLDSTSLTRRHPDSEGGRQIDHDELVGELFEPPGEDPAPGVLALHGSEGRPLGLHAAMLAQRGFTVFAPQYFFGPGLSDTLEEVPLEYIETAIDWLLDHDRTTGDQVGLYGVSKGAELALLTGSEYASVGPVVSVAGSGLVWAGVTSSENSLSNTSSWSRDGDPVPYISWAPDADPNPPFRQAYADSLAAASDEEISAATIPVEEISGPVVLVSGGDDNVWNTEELHRFAEQRLADHDHPAFEHLVYEDAGHAIRPPYYPVAGLTTEFYGGSGQGNAEAAHDYWPQVIEAFDRL